MSMMQGADYHNYRWNGHGVHVEFDRNRGYLRPARSYNYHHGISRDYERHSMFNLPVKNDYSESESSISSCDREENIRDAIETIEYLEKDLDEETTEPPENHRQNSISYAAVDVESEFYEKYYNEFPEYKDKTTHEWYQKQVCSYFSISNSCLPQLFEN